MKLDLARSQNSVSVFAVSSLVAMALIGCSKGGNTPEGWTSEVMVKKQCAESKAAFTPKKLEALVKQQAEAVKSTPINSEKSSNQIVIRNYLKKKTVSDGLALTEQLEIDAAGLYAAKDISSADLEKSSVHVTVDCATLEAQYSGPGLEEVAGQPTILLGKVTKFTATSMEMTFDTKVKGESFAVKIEHPRASRKEKKKEFAQEAMKIAKGEISIVITTEAKDANGEKLTRVFVQESALKTSLISVDSSIAALKKQVRDPSVQVIETSALKQGVSAPAAAAETALPKGEVKMTEAEILEVKALVSQAVSQKAQLENNGQAAVQTGGALPMKSDSTSKPL